MYAFKLAMAIVLSSLVAAQTLAISDRSKAQIIERLKPVGEVCVEGQDGCAAAAAAGSGEPRSAEDIVNASCNACHVSGAAGAPVIGDKAAWADRIAAGMDSVYSNAINGIGGMPAKGLCMDCSDDEIKVAIDLMVSQSQ